MSNNNDKKILNVPALRFPEFSGEWKKVKVSNLLDFYPTNSLSWEQLDYNNGQIKNLHYGLIHKGLPTMVDASFDTLPYIKEEIMPKLYTLFTEGDVAFADASEDTNDVAKAIEIINCDSQQIVSGLHTIHGRDNSNQTIIGYKGYAFASKAFHKQIRRIAQGTKVFSISVRNFDEVYIGIPSKEEQAKIAKLLMAIDKRIASQNKIIEKLESLIRGIVTKICSGAFVKGKYVFLRDILIERHIKNTENYEVYSVSVSQGIINQIDYLGRSFAAKETLHYNVVNYGDIVYTKSPTGDFPYGIVKRSHIKKPVAVSPLYGVYQPKNDYIGKYLHLYFKSPINTKNYLHRLIQKGAKNTINITNSHFLDNNVFIPEKPELINIVNLTSAIEDKLVLASRMLDLLKSQKGYLLSKMFI